MRIVRYAAVGLVLVAAAVVPGRLAAQTPKPTGPDTVVFDASRGKVTFAHGVHAKANECTSCHHASRPEKPATAENQKCSVCHTSPAAEPMKTSLKAAMHNTAAGEGTCFDCHKKQAAAGKTVPSACGDCHKRETQ